MHRCSSSHGNMVGPCSCGVFHSQSSSFSMLFSMPNHEADMCPYTTSSVDCTLSLGTPSTRLSSDNGKGVHHDRRSSNYVSNFCWDILQSKHTPSSPPSHKNTSRGGNSNAAMNSGGDPLLARRCANCDTTSTPLWRNGPRGPKSLCNACGIRFKKEERRATAAACGGAAPGVVESQHVMNSSWAHHHSQNQKIPCFIDDDDDNRDSDVGMPFLSWRLNVADRTSLIHDFTR